MCPHHYPGGGRRMCDPTLESAARGEAPEPDLILLDINLPRKNGHEVLAFIGGNDHLAPTCVVMCSSSISFEDICKGTRQWSQRLPAQTDGYRGYGHDGNAPSPDPYRPKRRGRSGSIYLKIDGTPLLSELKIGV